MTTVERDAGVTLTELVVTMSVMSVFGAIATAGVVQMHRSFTRTDTAATAQSEINFAFLRLDSQIRYATGISTPRSGPNGDPYVEFRTNRSGVDMCTEMRLSTASARLQWRTWTQGGTPGAWTTLAAEVSSTTPFTYNAPGTAAAYQSLSISLTATVTDSVEQFQGTFAALNTDPGTDSANYCVEGQAVP